MAAVFRAAGEMGEARKVLAARDERLAWHQRRNEYLRADGVFYFPLENPLVDIRFGYRWVWDLALRWSAGYGYHPKRALVAILVLIAVASGLAQLTWNEGSFAPNLDVILVSDGWEDLLAANFLPDHAGAVVSPDCVQNPAMIWSNDPLNGLDWDSFNAIGYGADLVIPLVDLGQNAVWAPSKDRGDWGWWLWWGHWVLVGLGWIVTALGAAAVSGIMQRGSPE